MEQVKVLSAWMSPAGMRPLIAMEERGVKYDYQEEALHIKSDLLLQMNPLYKKIPVLIHNGQPICEFLIILQYIDETWGSQKFLPYNSALARFWADFIDKKLMNSFPVVDGFFDSGFHIVKSKDEEQEQAKPDMLENFIFLEGAFKEMSGGGSLPFFSGKNIEFLDIAFIPLISWFHTYETIGNFKIPFDTEYPLLHAWVKRCMERESVNKILPYSDRILQVGLKIRKKFVVD